MKPEEKNHHLYVMLSMTGTLPSRVLQGKMKGQYSHCSISLDRNLHHMFSFGRLIKYIFIPGGMVHELPFRNVYSRYKHTICAIYEVPVTEEQYYKAEAMIKRLWKNRRKLRYNFPGILAANFKHYPEIPNHYYCTQFVARILKKSGVNFTEKKYVETDIFDFQYAKDFNLIYEGELRDYWNSYCAEGIFKKY